MGPRKMPSETEDSGTKIRGTKKVLMVTFLVAVAVILPDLGVRAYMMIRHLDASRLFFTIPFYKVLRAPDSYTTVNPFLVVQPFTDPPFNKDGYRASQSPLVPKKDNELRIFVMGGSTTASIKLETSYSELLEQQLDAHFKDLA